MERHQKTSIPWSVSLIKPVSEVEETGEMGNFHQGKQVGHNASSPHSFHRGFQT